MYSVPYSNCIYNSLPEHEPLGSKHVGDIKIKNKKKYINLENVHFFGLCCIIHNFCEVSSQCTFSLWKKSIDKKDFSPLKNYSLRFSGMLRSLDLYLFISEQPIGPIFKSKRSTASPLKTGERGFPETSVTNRR